MFTSTAWPVKLALVTRHVCSSASAALTCIEARAPEELTGRSAGGQW